ncbi:MAG: signal peptidase II [Candidatus Ratteibacteria bacterium]|nr:signal peptidase II [Candidatus Ratteibacteria bacterium]
MAIRHRIFFLSALLSVVADQLSKYLMISVLSGPGSFSVFRYFSLTLVRNTGICFGMFNNLNIRNFIIVASIFIAVGIFLFFKEYSEDKHITAAFGLIEGGIIGNLIDRIRTGAVIDFINFHIWPVFNLADTFIVVGVVIILLKQYKKNKVRPQ